jgi:hypothetical protein
MNQSTFREIVEKILAKYSNDVQSLIAGHTPFNDGVEADRWRTQAQEAISNLVEEEVKKAKPSEKNISFLRQWLNEDRITDPKRLVTNDMIKHWLELSNE